ncbi:MAG: FmdB family zinc ribbon protein [Vulcanimicrobiaceae bacterium]
MPLYDYQCATCHAVTEVRHGFGEVHEAPCPSCGGKLMRVFNPAPILFRGSGFYATDSRASASQASAAAEKTAAPQTLAPAEAKPAAAQGQPAASPAKPAGSSESAA